MPPITVKRRLLVLVIVLILMITGAVVWFAKRYDDRPQQVVPMTAFSKEAYPDNLENTSQALAHIHTVN